MQALTFWKTVTGDETNLLETLLAVLAEQGVRYCVIGGQAVNAYVEPVVSLDLDLVIAADQVSSVEALLRKQFRVERFPHSLNISQSGSRLRVQIQTDPRYEGFLQGAVEREVLGLKLPVARLEDVLRGKIWAVTDPERRPSKQLKDLADIARILESYPELRAQVPPEVLARISAAQG